MQNIDNAVFFTINCNLANPACDAVIKFFMYFPGSALIVLTAVAAFFIGKKYTKLTALIALSSYVIAQYSCRTIKLFVKRPRPFEVVTNAHLPLGPHGGFSFPSGHATISFCLATVIAMRYPKARYPVFIAAIFIALSRVYLGVHYPTDILAGAMLGILIGYIVTKTANKCEEAQSLKRV